MLTMMSACTAVTRPSLSTPISPQSGDRELVGWSETIEAIPNHLIVTPRSTAILATMTSWDRMTPSFQPPPTSGIATRTGAPACPASGQARCEPFAHLAGRPQR